jgi:predicted chitinase
MDYNQIPVTMRAMRIAWNKTQYVVIYLVNHMRANFTRLVENTNYSAQGMDTWPTRFAVNSNAKIKEPNQCISLHMKFRSHRK